MRRRLFIVTHTALVVVALAVTFLWQKHQFGIHEGITAKEAAVITEREGVFSKGGLIATDTKLISVRDYFIQRNRSIVSRVQVCSLTDGVVSDVQTQWVWIWTF